MDEISWQKILKKDRPLFFGILNCTPDSFSDGGKYIDEVSIKEKIDDLIFQGSDVIDFGAESTRPGAKQISSEEQLQRVASVLKNIDDRVLFSVDTRDAKVAQNSLDAGVRIINDVSGGNFDEQMLEVISDKNALCVLMHMRGIPENMTEHASYKNVVDEVCDELALIARNAIDCGVPESLIMLDPGIGFAKSAQDSLILLRNIEKIKKRLDMPILVGHSRKSFISVLFDSSPEKVKMEQKEWATHYLSSYLYEQGIDALRVHNPLQSIQSIKFVQNFLRK